MTYFCTKRFKFSFFFQLEDGDPFKWSPNTTNTFTIYGGQRALICAAQSAEEKSAWLEDLTAAVIAAKEGAGDAPIFQSLKSVSSVDDVEARLQTAGGGSGGGGGGGTGTISGGSTEDVSAAGRMNFLI